MAQSYLIFDFGANEDLAQQARRKLEGWRQAFHLTNKLEFKLERKPGAKAADPETVRLAVRLDFSDHEKLSHQRWLERIPSETLFKEASPKVTRSGDPDFAKAVEFFDSLELGKRGRDLAARNK
jgi:hypothetical protein